MLIDHVPSFVLSCVQDIYTIDESIPQTVRWYLGCLAKVSGTLLYTCVVTPLFAVGLLPLAAFYYVAQVT